MSVVFVDRPTVEGSLVYLTWTSSQPLEKVRGSKFYLEYVGVPVDGLPSWVHQSSAIALLVARLEEMPGQHLLVVDGPVPRWVVTLWGGYHGAKNVSIVAEQFDDDDVAEPSMQPAANPHFGLLFGGGKDSLFALDLIREAFPRARVSLISYTIPAAHVKMTDLERRREGLAVSGAAERYGAGIIRVRTDARSVFDQFFFHTELYTATMLPLLYLTDLSALTFSYEYCHYWTRYADGTPSLNFRKSRPEHCAAISTAYSRALGRRLDLFNANAFMSELSSFLYLARKRPTFASEVMMCEAVADPNVKWCRNCTKCMEYSLFSTLADPSNTELPASEFLADSPWARKVLPKVQERLSESPGDPSRHWFPALTFAGHIDSFAHVIDELASTDGAGIRGAALDNLRLLADAYARPGLDAEKAAYENVLRRTWPAELQEAVLAVVRSRIEVIPTAPLEKMWGNSSVGFDDGHDEIPTTYSPPVEVGSFAGDLVALGGRFEDPRVVRSHSSHELKVAPLGAMDRDALRVARSSRWVDVHSAVGAPRRGDGFAIVGRFSKPDGMTAAECCVRVASPYSGSATGWLALRVAVAGRTVLDVDLVEFGGSFILTAPTTDDSVDVRVDVVALKDCNDWGWGGAMRTCVEVLGWQSVKATNLPGPRLTYPGNTVDADPEPQPPHLEETLAARVHWASQGREDFYDTGQHWRTYMAERVRAYRPRSVLEFGCNAGRNLVEVRRLLPAAKVIGIDINAEAVAHGHEKYGLDLRVGGEELLTKHDERAIDVLFTVSVLDHLPHAEEVLREITRIAGTAVILLEPFTGQSRRVDVATDAPALTTVLYTYAWDYPEMCNRVAPDWHWTWTPYPLSGENLGPNYWLIEGTRSVRRE